MAPPNKRRSIIPPGTEPVNTGVVRSRRGSSPICSLPRQRTYYFRAINRKLAAWLPDRDRRMGVHDPREAAIEWVLCRQHPVVHAARVDLC